MALRKFLKLLIDKSSNTVIYVLDSFTRESVNVAKFFSGVPAYTILNYNRNDKCIGFTMCVFFSINVDKMFFVLGQKA